MANLLSIDIRCSECNHQWDDLVERELRDYAFLCTECGNETGRRTFSPPNGTRASYVDGTRRSGWSEIREVNALKQESAGKSKSRRDEIAREIRNVSRNRR